MDIQNINSNNNINFGMQITNGSKKLIKSRLPLIIEKEGLEQTKKTVQKLVELTHKDDGIIANITAQENNMFPFFDIGVKDEKLRHFIYSGYPTIKMYEINHDRNGSCFPGLVKLLSSEEFTNTANNAIKEEHQFMQIAPRSRKLLDKLGLFYLPENMKKAFENTLEFLEESFSYTEYIGKNKKIKKIPTVFSEISTKVSELFSKLNTRNSLKNNRNSNEIRELSKVIDSL